MAPLRKILIADPDPATARALGPALRRRGYRLLLARDGSRALQLAILRTPDVVLLDEKAAFPDAGALLAILRTNPRTERIPVVLTGERDEPERGRLGQYLRKPLDAGEVLARLDRALRRADAARAAAGDAALRGDLAQLPLVDLLQILAVNRKTGRLELERGGARAEIALLDGALAEAAAGGARGEKALYRLLSWREGRFAFVTGGAARAGCATRRVEEAILEGLRQCDEVARLLPSLPDGGERLALAIAPTALPDDLHPVTAEVASFLARPRALQEVLDGVAAPDLEVLRAVAALLECGYARREPAQPAGATSLLGERELRGLRRRLTRAGATGGATGKVILAGGGPLSRRAALVRFGAVPGYSAQAGGAPVDFGTLGRLTIGDAHLDVVALPSDPALAPLWRPFARGAVGILVLAPADGIGARLAALARDLRCPVGACGPCEESVGDELRSAGCAVLGGDPAEALRALLGVASRGE